MKTELQVAHEHVDELVSAACMLHNLIVDKEGIDEATLQKINLQIQQKLEHRQLEDKDATTERREKLTAFENDTKFILKEKVPLICNKSNRHLCRRKYTE